MLAGCYVGERRIVVEEREPAPPGPGEVAVDVAYTGICGTDLHVLHGAMADRVHLPAVLGHEMSGTVHGLGEGVSGWETGDAVVVMPLDWCGDCPACRSGNSHICQRLNFIGIDSPGSMQGRYNVPERTLLRLPQATSLRAAALTEPTAVAVHDVRRAGVVPGERALVVGGGPIGLLIACVARHAGADVLVAEPSPERRAIGASLGLRCVDPTPGDRLADEPASRDAAPGDSAAGRSAVEMAALIEDWTGGAGVPVAFEVSSAPAGLALAVSSLAVRGRLGLVAIHSRPVPVDLHRVFLRELSVVGSRVYERADFEEAVRLVSSGVIPTDELTTAVLPLREVGAAFARLEAGTAMKLLVDCSEAG